MWGELGNCVRALRCWVAEASRFVLRRVAVGIYDGKLKKDWYIYGFKGA